MAEPIQSTDTDIAVPPVHRVEHEEPWNALRIDLDVVVDNFRRLQSAFPASAPLYIVLKADAYGHGLVEVGRSLVLAGCRRLAVETPQEGIRLRKEGIEEEILLLNPIPSWMASLAVHYGFTVTVIHESILPPLAEAALARGRECPVHLNVNVGLHRMGIAPSRLPRLARQVQASDGLRLAGMYAQPRDNHSARASFERLVELHNNLAAKDLAPPLVHFANSTAFLAHEEMARIGARLGILVYGILPPEDARQGTPDLGLRPAMTVTTEVVQLRDLAPGSRIGYRARTRTTRETRVATIPMGYAHGLDRKLAKGGCVLLQGRRVPFIGAISMNSATLDITDLDEVGIGDTVTDSLSPKWQKGNSITVVRRYHEGLKCLIFHIYDQDVVGKHTTNQLLGMTTLVAPKPGIHSLRLYREDHVRPMPGWLLVEIKARPLPIPAPNLLGLDLDAARKKAKDQTFKVQSSTLWVRHEPRKGVVRQQPKEGAMIELGSTITCYVQKQRLYAMPKLVGQDMHRAKRIVVCLPFRIKFESTQEGTGNVDNWYRVVGQTPEPGTRMPALSKGTVTICRPGPGTKVKVPDVTGQNIHGARRILVKHHLLRFQVTYQECPRGQSGRVLKQEPRPGQEVEYDRTDKIELLVGKYASGLSVNSPKTVRNGEPFPCPFADGHACQYRRIVTPGPGYLVMDVLENPEGLWPEARLCDDQGPVGDKVRLTSVFGNTGSMRVTKGPQVIELRSNCNRACKEPLPMRFRFVPEFDAAEPNDRPEDARPIQGDTLLQLGFASSGDEDWYAIDMEKPGYILIHQAETDASRAQAGTGDIKAAIYTRKGERVSRGKLIELLWLEQGSYYLRLVSELPKYTLKPYRISVTFPPDTDRTEPNNNPRSAAQIPASGSHLVRYTSEDSDYYNLTSQEPGWIIFSHPRKVGHWTTLRRVQANGKTDTKQEVPCVLPIEKNLTILLQTTEEGRALESFAPIPLNTQFIPRSADPLEPNDNPAQARRVETNQPFPALSLPAHDIDHYRFTLKKGGTVRIALTAQSPSRWMSCTILDDSGKNLDKGGSLPFETTLEPGTYIVAVGQWKGVKDFSLEPYVLCISTPDAPPAQDTGGSERFADDQEENNPGDGTPGKAPAPAPGKEVKAKQGLGLARQAYLAYRKQKYVRAIELYEQAAALIPRCAPVFNDLGSCLVRLGRFDRAREMFTRAAALDPDYDLPLRNLGVAARKTGDLAGYVKWTEKSVRVRASAINLRFHAHALLLQAGEMRKGPEWRARLEAALAACERSLALEANPAAKRTLTRLKALLEE